MYSIQWNPYNDLMAPQGATVPLLRITALGCHWFFEADLEVA